MTNSIRVLVTGAGSGVGQGIIKSLRASSLNLTILAADIHPLNSGLFRADEAIIIPKVENTGAKDSIVRILIDNRIDVLMIGSEFDLIFFSENREEIQRLTGALIVASDIETVLIADDKWRTCCFLENNHLPYAQAFLPEDANTCKEFAAQLGYPCVLKTRSGTSNRHVHIISNEAELQLKYPQTPFPMLQKLIATPSDVLQAEYTCSIFKCKDGSILGPFTARRTLRGGNSWHIEVDRFEGLEPLLLRIGELLPIMGSLNVQLMVGKDGPVPFEFNARFSGTTAVRSYFGFNEPEMLIRNYFLGEKLTTPVIRKGIALRYLEEVFVDDVSTNTEDLISKRGKVMNWF